jgi:transcriptional regulator with XRE-family HTH domain
MSHVYFLHAIEPNEVKIGFTTNLTTRLLTLINESPRVLTILRVINGDRSVERWLHDYYAERRIRGEWFHFDESMLTVTPGSVLPGAKELTYRLPAEFAKLLRNEVLGRGVTRRDIADSAGCSVRSIEHWLSGRFFPQGTQVISLMRAFPAVRAFVETVVAEGRFPDPPSGMEAMRHARDALEKAKREGKPDPTDGGAS